jgi:V/A-type H+-transporting ATPase subunit E
MAEPARESSGVQALIDRLREEGVETGRAEADRLVADARDRAAAILADAREEAEAIRAEARDDAAAEKRAADQAMKLAARDTVLSLKQDMAQRFAQEVKRLVTLEMKDRAFLRRLILEVAARTAEEVPEGEPARAVLPREAVGVEELRAKPEEAREGTLAHHVLGLSREMLRAGVELSADGEQEAGIRLKLTERDMEIDLTDEAVAALLLRHLLPRFRALLEGIVR